MVQIRWEGFGGDLAVLQAQMDRLLETASSRAVVLMDSAGRLLTLAGDAPHFDLTTFVSLMAADFCATRELARILGEDTFHTVYHQVERPWFHISVNHGRKRIDAAGAADWQVKRGIRFCQVAILTAPCPKGIKDTGTIRWVIAQGK
jgi:hypothetical protein